MAAVDSLLRLIKNRGAEALIVASGEIAVLRRGGANEALSMPPMAASLVAGFVVDVMSEELRATLDKEGSVETVYAGDQNFSVQAQVYGQGYRLVFVPQVKAAERPTVVPATPMPSQMASVVSVEQPLPTQPADVALIEILSRASSASDIMVSTTANARIRVGGVLRELEGSHCSEASLLGLVQGLGALQQRAFAQEGSVDFPLDLRAQIAFRFRVNLFRRHGGFTAAFRPIRTTIPTLRQLCLPENFASLTKYNSGLVLITGPAGSGKSTTLVALIEQLNQRASKHIITLEDPIEYEYQSQFSLIHQREVGTHVQSFDVGLRAALRESPDIIMLGEMRDKATVAAALTAAETGHLVLATLHARGTAAAVDRIIDVFAGDGQGQIRTQLASSLRAVVTQILVPTQSPPRRVPAYEKMVVNDAIAAMIRDDKCHQISSQIQTGRSEGMIPLDTCLANLVRGHDISLSTAKSVATDPAQLDLMLR